MAQEDGQEGMVERRGGWKSVVNFLTKGSARWAALVGVGLLVGTVCLVTENPGTVSQLRQQLLLKNAGAGAASTQAVRRSLSGTDPVHRAWDDVKKVKHSPQQLAAVSVDDEQPAGNSFSQFLAATSRSSRKAHASPTGSLASCAGQCDANGYSSAVAGATAAKACVDVCLEEHGSQVQHTLATPAADSTSDQEDAASRLLAKVRSQMPGEQQQAITGKTMPGNLVGIASAFGVDSVSLPKAERAQLKKAMQLDNMIAAREAKDRAQLRTSWGVAVKDMRTLDAARLENAKSLSKATQRAVAENKATLALDASLLSAAAQYQKSLGKSASASNVPVDAPKAELELEAARSARKKVQRAAAFAGEILSDEAMKWKTGNQLVDRQLNAGTFVDPGSSVEGKFWSAVLKDASSMPKADAGKVRLAAMSDGKLLAMEKGDYSQQRKSMAKLATDVRDMQAARAANAQIVAKHMAKMAAQKKADTQLLAAEARYQSTVTQIGGKSKLAGTATDLNGKILKDAQQARALQLAAQAGSAMAHRYGTAMASSAANEAMSALGKTGSADAAKQGVAHVTHEAHVKHTAHKKGATGALSGEQAVANAAQGWFSPY
mmetsp:Transcript_49658/g.72902  ORF Transcript_49658/g.72902 Transcript_49658/m.72902 type:complete len:605 (+) Transcript_49658:494-2308(+)